MQGHLTTERLHDLLEGLLEGDDLAEAEAHLGVCAECADRLAGVSELLDALAGLPAEARPPRDLWPEIRGQIAATAQGGPESRVDGGPAKVLAFPATAPGASARPRLGRSLQVTVPQLAAAAILVSLLSAGSVWLTLRGPLAGPPAPGSGVVAEAPAPADDGRGFVTAAALPMETALEDLEAALTEGRDLLDPGTLAVLEESLATIDVAIAEARTALAADPGSELLNRLLMNHQRSKLRVLQKATAGLIQS